MNDLKLSLVQESPLWHQPEANRELFAKHLAALAGKSELIVLPEVFTSGFSMDADLGSDDEYGAPTSAWMLEQAKSSGSAICGSTVFLVDGGHRNRLLFATPEGELHHYDKTHLFRMAGEHERYDAGDQRTVIEYRGWRFLLTICYDLRFPVFCRNRMDYDVLLCVANWPSARRVPWRALLQARAIENLAYVAGVNRVGVDGNNVPYCGDSLLYDFKGTALIDEPQDAVFARTETLSMADLEGFRDKFQAWKDADDFELKGYPRA